MDANEKKAVVKKPRADGQLSGLAGEFLVAAELLKRDMQTSVTFGNAKAIDLFAINAKTERSFKIQVKTTRSRNVWPISHKKVQKDQVYVFVVLNKPGQPAEFFIVPGAKLKDEPELFTKWFVDPKFPGIDYKTLKSLGFAEQWGLFNEMGGVR